METMSDYELIVGLMSYLKQLDTRLDEKSGLPDDEFIDILKNDSYEFEYLNRKLFNDLL